MTPDYYQNVQGDLYDEFVLDYGLEAVRLHLIMQAREYLKRAHTKGQRASDLGKVRVLLARLLEWEEASSPTLEDRPHTDLPQVHGVGPQKTCDEMATILSASGYLVREGRLSEEDWQAIGKKEGYTQAPDMCACGHRSMVHNMPAKLVDGLAPCGVCSCHNYDDSGQNVDWQEDAQGFTIPALSDEAQETDNKSFLEMVQDQLKDAQHAFDVLYDASQHRTTHNGTSPETVLDHCLAADQARQGVAVRSEVVELLTRAHIQFNGLWADHAAEVDRVFHERWPWEPKEVQS